jgi:hypothetical protein
MVNVARFGFLNYLTSEPRRANIANITEAGLRMERLMRRWKAAYPRTRHESVVDCIEKARAWSLNASPAAAENPPLPSRAQHRSHPPPNPRRGGGRRSYGGACAADPGADFRVCPCRCGGHRPNGDR